MKEARFWPQWPVKISDDGMFIFSNPDQWEKFKIPYYGKEMTLVLKARTKDRSRQEEKFYYGVVVRMVAEEMDIGRQEAHQWLAKLFLTVEEVTRTGLRYKRVLSTTELGDKAYREYWERCIKWAALPTSDEGLGESSGLGLYIPMPNEVDYTDAY